MNFWFADTKNSWPWGHAIEALLDNYWRHLLAQYQTLYVGYSGGLDSTVLLHSLVTEPLLAGKIRAVHVHHGLSPNANLWQKNCQMFCEEHGIPFLAYAVSIDTQANIEDAARKARYQIFSSLLKQNDALLLGHHQDDQAETLLLQLFRGAGVDGLSAMAVRKKWSSGEMLRPFLQHTKQTLALYARRHTLHFIEDESNQDERYSRNFVRHRIMPLVQSKWPHAVQNLSRTAEHCQQAKANLLALAVLDCKEVNEASTRLPLAALYRLNRERRTNVIRAWFHQLQIALPSATILERILDELISVREDAIPCVTFGEVCVRRFKDTLYLLEAGRNHYLESTTWEAFPLPLRLGNSGEYLQAFTAMKGALIRPGARVEVRFRHGGERFYWHGQTKMLKKLFQEWNVPPWERDTVPLIVVDSQVIAVVGFAVSDHSYAEGLPNLYSFGKTRQVQEP